MAGRIVDGRGNPREEERLGPPRSLWTATASGLTSYPTLVHETEADVAIVGAGFTGLSAALHLARAGRKVVVLESHGVGWGASGRNGGQVIPGIKYGPDEIEAIYGPQLGARMVEAVGAAADHTFALIRELGIDCDAEQRGWLQPCHSDEAAQAAQGRMRQWQTRGADVEWLGASTVADMVGTKGYRGGWIDRRGGQVQPLSYVSGLASAAHKAGARIFTNSTVLSLVSGNDGHELLLANGTRLRAHAVILATNAQTGDLWPGLRRTVVPVVSAQIATVPLSGEISDRILPAGLPVSDTRRLLRYYRRDTGGRVIMGGRGPLLGEAGKASFARIRGTLLAIWPELRDIPSEHQWSGRVAMTADHKPHLHVLAPGLFAGLGFNGRGVALSNMMGTWLGDLALGRPHKEIPFPVTAVKPIPAYPLRLGGIAIMIAYYKLLDWAGF